MKVQKINAESKDIWDYAVFISNLKDDVNDRMDEIERKIIRTEERILEKIEELKQKIELEKQKARRQNRKANISEMENQIRRLQIKYRELEEYVVGKGKIVKIRGKYASAFQKNIRHLRSVVKKLDAMEMQEAYQAFSAEKSLGKKTTRMKFRGITFETNNELFDFDTVYNGKTNLQRMSKGNAPVGKDGLYIELHHLIQSEHAGIAETSGTMHRKNHKTIHINDSSIPSGINRSSFDGMRANYWKRRAEFELMRRAEEEKCKS